MGIRVELITRSGCHLCEDAKAALEAARAELSFELVELDLAEHPELRDPYRYDVPVVRVGGEPLFRHRVEPEALRRALLERGAVRRGEER